MDGTCTSVISAPGLGHYGSSSSCTRIAMPSGVVIGVGDVLSVRIIGGQEMVELTYPRSMRLPLNGAS
ncbi:hypothetical protein B0T18DRAFT_404353 [Schizothecium vesticola]|uniref:Uncharacterized protein n=1 Tax=Schizothecium vesticola TaxID=314040 RepID=A0AA40F6Q5_9PEZI|nr:hypothetical protein B0T18DRAFT_404353 [Schizothecium vesticola]